MASAPLAVVDPDMPPAEEVSVLRDVPDPPEELLIPEDDPLVLLPDGLMPDDPAVPLPELMPEVPLLPAPGERVPVPLVPVDDPVLAGLLG